MPPPFRSWTGGGGRASAPRAAIKQCTEIKHSRRHLPPVAGQRAGTRDGIATLRQIIKQGVTLQFFQHKRITPTRTQQLKASPRAALSLLPLNNSVTQVLIGALRPSTPDPIKPTSPRPS